MKRLEKLKAPLEGLENEAQEIWRKIHQGERSPPTSQIGIDLSH